MLARQAFIVASVLAGASLVSAHGHIVAWTIDGVKQGSYIPQRGAQNGPTAQRPTVNMDNGFSPIDSRRVVCTSDVAGTGVQTWDVNGGSKIKVTWDQWPESHHGPVIEYMARCPSSGCDGVDERTLDWFKISEAGFTGGISQSAADKLIANGFSWDFTIPSDIATGPYLVRHEIIAMHESNQGAPQLYPVCFQANVVRSSGSVIPSQTSKIPANYNINPMYKTYDIYTGKDFSAFVPPGPPVYRAGSGGGNPPPAPPSSSSVVAVPPSSTSGVPPTTPRLPATSSSAAASSSRAPASTSRAPATTSNATTVQPSTSSAAQPPAPSQGGNNGGNTAGEKYNQCMRLMNACKDRANKLPNAEVAAAHIACDNGVGACMAARRSLFSV